MFKQMHLISLVVSLSLIFCLVGCSQQQEVSYKSGGMTQTMAHGKNAVRQLAEQIKNEHRQ